MSHKNILGNMSSDEQKTLEDLTQANNELGIRTYLTNFKKEDVEAYLLDKGITTPIVKPPVPVKSSTTAPAGADDVKSMISGSFTGANDPVDPAAPPPSVPDVTEKEMMDMWTEIDKYDVSLLDPDVVEAFKYQGFNPNAILMSLMKSKKSAKISNDEFLKDITTLCALAVIKGSVTNKNLVKMSDTGKARYDMLEKRYNIIRGGGKGKAADVVTVARIGAAFPGKIVQLLQTKKVPGRDFVSELQTHKLPGVLKHQALAACVPQDMAERSRMFLLDLVTAFSVDQTKNISGSKDSISDLIDRQKQFTLVSHSGAYPPENMRKLIIKGFTWSDLFPMILPVATHIKGKWNDFHTITQQEFLDDIGKLA